MGRDLSKIPLICVCRFKIIEGGKIFELFWKNSVNLLNVISVLITMNHCRREIDFRYVPCSE